MIYFEISTNNHIVFSVVWWCMQEPGQLLHEGIHNVRYIAYDEAGNRAECHFTIQIRGIHLLLLLLLRMLTRINSVFEFAALLLFYPDAWIICIYNRNCNVCECMCRVRTLCYLA